jgi:hypothetical protein
MVIYGLMRCLNAERKKSDFNFRKHLVLYVCRTRGEAPDKITPHGRRRQERETLESYIFARAQLTHPIEGIYHGCSGDIQYYAPVCPIVRASRKRSSLVVVAW